MSIIFITPQAERGARDRRPHHGAAPRQDGRDRAARRARPRQSLARLMVGREVLLRVEKAPPSAGEPLLEVEDLRSRDDRGLADGARRLVRRPRRRDRRHRRRRRQRPDASWSRPSPGLRRPRARARSTLGGDGRHAARARASIARRGPRPHPGGSPAPRPRPRLHDRREHRAPRLPASRRTRASAGSSRRRLIERARRAHPGVRRPRRRTRDARPARSPAATSRRSCSPARSTRDPSVLIAAQPTRGLDVGAIEFVHRRLVEERDEGARSCSSRSSSTRSCRSPTASSSCTRARSSASSPPTRHRGGARDRDDRRHAKEARGMSERGPPAARRAAGPEPSEPRRALRRSCRRPAGLVAPLLTVVLAFVIGGLVVLAHDGSHNPLETYRAIFNGAGLTWFFHVGSYDIGSRSATRASGSRGTRTTSSRSRPANLQQTLILLDAARSHRPRRRVRVPLRPLQHRRPGPVPRRARSSAVWVATELPSAVDLPGILLIVVDRARRDARGRALAGIAGFLKATVGAHEVITTIMLNWIVVWVGVVPLRHRRAAPERTAGRSVPIVRATSPTAAKLPVFWGDPLLQGLHIGFFVAHRARSSSTRLILNRTTLGYEVRAVGFNPEAARYGGISVARNYFLAMAISGLFAGLAGAIDILGWQFRLDITTSRARPSASSGSPSRCSAGTRRSASASPRSSSPRSDRDVVAEPRSRRLPARARDQPHAHHPGARRALRRRRPRRLCCALDARFASGRVTRESLREASSPRMAGRGMDRRRRRRLRAPSSRCRPIGSRSPVVSRS